MEEEEPSGDAKEARGEKRKVEGDEMELERSGGQAESSGKGMEIEAVMMNDEEAWDDVRGCWLDRGKSAGGKAGGGGLHGEKKALGRSVEKRRVGPQDSVCEVEWTPTKAPRRIQRYGAGSWLGTSEASTRIGRIFSRLLRRGS